MDKGLIFGKKRKLLYLFLTIMPITIAFCVILINFFDKSNSFTSVIAKNGAANLANASFESNSPITVSGEFDFFWDKYIVSDNLTDAKPDFLIDVPSQWSSYKINGQALPSRGKASYRIRLESCPENRPITAYLPDIDCTYRVFLNNQLVYSLIESRPEQVYTYITDDPLPRNSVLTIEVLSRYSNGLYVAPVLRCSDGYASSSSFTSFVGAALFGMNLLALAFYAFIICTNKSAAPLVWRVSLTVLAMVVVFSKDTFFDFWRAYLPIGTYYFFSILTHSAIALLPFMSMNFLSALAMMNFDPVIKKTYGVLGVVASLVAFAVGMSGQMKWFGIVLLVSLLPLLHVIIKLNKYIKTNVKYSCNLTSATLYLFFALAFEALIYSGFIQHKFILLSPIFLTVSTISVATYFARKSLSMESEAKEAAQLRLTLRESEHSLVLSQIKPHFLYNALVAIEMLCTEDPASAATAIRQFSEYLRSNMRSITAKDPIPFLEEMRHIESYAAIEMLRFKNRLKYSSNLEVTSFYVPPLTIQPLVENAIKHGACQNIRGGSVHVHSYETEHSYCVAIIDDGVGFDKSLTQNSAPHGLSNIEMRLTHLMNARLEIFSEIGKGTRAVVTIPKRKEE